MTPAATTPAGTRTTRRGGSSPRVPRRVSGPAGGRGAAKRPSARSGTARAGATRAPARRAPAERTAIPRRSARATAPRRKRQASLALRTVAAVRGLPDRPLLDRLVRGRAWIPLLGVMLVGIVFMQVEVLKLGASIGRSLEQETGLQSRNEALRASVAALADDQRIERIAAAHGMVVPAPDGVGFLSARRADAVRAASNIHTPNSRSFLSLLTSNGNVTSQATPPVTSTTTTPSVSSTTTTPSLSTSTSSSGVAPPTTSSVTGVAGATATASAAGTTSTASTSGG